MEMFENNRRGVKFRVGMLPLKSMVRYGDMTNDPCGGPHMDEITCSFCGIEMKDKDLAFGISRGSIAESCNGFRIDEDSDWDVYCSKCMDEIDKVLADYKRARGK